LQKKEMDELQQNKKLYSGGLFYAIICYCSWGVFPLFWKLLLDVPSTQILAHRIVWSVIFLAGLMLWRGDRTFLTYFTKPKTLGLLCITGALIGGNWFVYIYAVNHNHIVDSSLGYYINPMVNVLLGVVFMKERLNKLQKWAVFFAVAGIVCLTISVGRLPWISLFLALSFALYGLLRKKANLESLPGLLIETLLLAPFALFYLWQMDKTGNGAFLHISLQTTLLLILAGPVTAIPMYWFGIAATRIPLSMLGFLQYLSPTLQLLLGVFLYREPFTTVYLISFTLVWIGLGIYIFNMIKGLRENKKPASV